MIIRLVHMHFQPDKLNEFFAIFESSKGKIAQFDGCLKLELLQSTSNPTQLTTHSIWKSDAHLEKYRESELFKSTWAKTKVLFSEKANAVSYSIVQ